VHPGHVVGPLSDEDLASLATLLDDPARRTRLGEAGRRLLVERFSGARVAEALETHYARLTAA
jgi:glycosyltransferase involved in cell wall biosynthesis